MDFNPNSLVQILEMKKNIKKDGLVNVRSIQVQCIEIRFVKIAVQLIYVNAVF